MMGRFCNYADTPRDLYPHYVYTAWRGSTPLYVGCTYDMRQRMKSHNKSWAQWVTEYTWIAWVEFPNRAAALDAETDRIGKLHPIHNRHLNRSSDPIAARVTSDLYPAALCERYERAHHEFYIGSAMAGRDDRLEHVTEVMTQLYGPPWAAKYDWYAEPPRHARERRVAALARIEEVA